MSGDIVAVFQRSRFDFRAECSCGYDGRRRITGTRAALDALLHCDDARCQPNWPLILRADQTGGFILSKVLPVSTLLLFMVALGGVIAALVAV